MGSKNVVLTINDIAYKMTRYVNFFNRNISFDDTFNKIWTPKFDPMDPDSGWGTRIHKTVFPLTGQNVEIVPKNTRGYLMDKSCNEHTWTGNAYSFTMYVKKEVSDTNKLAASVYCYVSKNFTGTHALLYAEGAVEGNRVSEYDLEKKGTWQRLALELKCTTGKAMVSMYFSKFGVTDFSSLEGYVIFAYPEYKISGISNTLVIVRHETRCKQKSNFQEIDTSQVFAQIVQYPKQTVRYASMSLFNIFKLIEDSTVNKYADKDPIRLLSSKFISEDTAYIGYKSKLIVKPFKEDFLGTRIMRWEFASEIFLKEYNVREKLIGGGYNFLNWYGYYFDKDKTKTDYPHNPFFSILLYSGVVGLVTYIILLVKIFKYYYKYRKQTMLFSIFFMITYYFAFFSGGNPFDPPIMGYFIMLPFFIHSCYKSEDKVEKSIMENE